MQIKREVRLPMMPNYLFVGNDDKIDIGELSDEDLKLFVDTYSKALYDHAKVRRSRLKETSTSPIV